MQDSESSIKEQSILDSIEDFPEPDLSPNSGWSDIQIKGVYRPDRSFVHSDPAGKRLRVEFFPLEEDNSFQGKVWFGPLAEGPPGCAHGGSIAAILDDAMGRCCWAAGYMVLAGRIIIDYRRRVSLKKVHCIKAWIEKIDGRKVLAKSIIQDRKGKLLSEGEGTFIQIDPDQFEREKAKLESQGYFSKDTEVSL